MSSVKQKLCSDVAPLIKNLSAPGGQTTEDNKALKREPSEVFSAAPGETPYGAQSVRV